MRENDTRIAVRFDHVSFSYGQGERSQSENRTHGDVKALVDIDITIPRGHVVLLCGDSGCGKTTVTRLINGLVPHYLEGDLEGSVTVAGRDVSNSTLTSLSRHVGSVFQNPRSQFFTLSVEGELAFACENFEIPPHEIRRRMADAERNYDIEGLRGRSISGLSGGQKQTVACAAVSCAGPSIMVLDEPSSNLDATSISRLRSVISMWRDEGRTVVIAEHRLYWLAGVVDDVVHMDSGRVSHILNGHDFFSMSDDARREWGLRPLTIEQIAESRMSGPASDPLMHFPCSPDTTACDASSVDEDCSGYRIDHFRYCYPDSKCQALSVPEGFLHAGKVTAIVGLNGAGKSTFARCLQGLDRRCEGRLVAADGTRLGRRRRLRECFTVFQDVNRELFAQSVLEEVMLSQSVENRDVALEAVRCVDLEAYVDRHPLSLSGGQKQRVMIAAALACERPIVVFDEPTSGLDARHMTQVATVVRRLAALGRVVVVVTHDPEFALLACDCVMELRQEKIASAYELDGANGRHLVDALVARI